MHYSYRLLPRFSIIPKRNIHQSTLINKVKKMAKIVEPNEQHLAEAAELIRKGGLVSFPTETGKHHKK